MSNPDEYVTDEQLAEELEDETTIDFAVVPTGIRMSYERVPKRTDTVQERLEKLILLLFSVHLLDDISVLDFDIYTYVQAEAEGMKESLIGQDLLTCDVEDAFEFIDYVIDHQQAEGRQAMAAEMLDLFKTHGLHGMYAKVSDMKPSPPAPNKGCVVCLANEPTCNVSNACKHTLCLCDECHAKLEVCPLCRATAADTTNDVATGTS